MSEPIFSSSDEDDDDESSNNHGETWKQIKYKIACSELRSRHSLVWQARVAYFLTIAGFFVLAQTNFFERTKLPASIFILAFTVFILIIDRKYQKTKRHLYHFIIEEIEKNHKLRLYDDIKRIDNKQYQIVLYGLMIIFAGLWVLIILLL